VNRWLPPTLALLALYLSPTAHADSVGKTVNWTANPSTIVQGAQGASIILSLPATLCGTSAGQLDDAVLNNPTAKPTVVAQAGFGVTVVSVGHTLPCELTVSLTATATALTGPMRLTLSAANAAAAGTTQDIGYATVTVVSSQASAIPAGLAQQVDVDYIVLPYQTAYDNYGRRVADQYYVVIPKIGNNTGFSLQLAGIGFAGSPTGNTDPSIVQGTLIYGQDYSARNILYRSIIWAAILGAGISPYFHSANAKANYTAGLALLSGPVLAGFSQQFPDNTVKQLSRLGASDVMTNQNIIPNNTQLSFVAFVGRDTICPPSCVRAVALCGQSEHFHHNIFYDPTEVKKKLGNVTIVGDLLPSFVARIKVTGTTSNAAPTTGVASTSAMEGVPTLIQLQSSGLTGASLTSPPSTVTATNVISDSSFQVSVLLTTMPATPITLTLTRKDGSTVAFPITVTQPVPVITPAAGATTISSTATTGVTISWKNGGPDLTRVVPTMSAADGVFALGVATATTITGTITPNRAATLTVNLPVSVNGIAITDLPALTVVSK
jgi:hypothetical protein